MDKNVKRVNKLILEISKGKIKSLDRLYEEFGGLLYLIARKYLYDKNYAEDIVSDVLLGLVKNAKQLKENKNGLNWLFKSIKNSALNYNKKNGRIAIEDIDSHFCLGEVFDEEALFDAIVIKDAFCKLDEFEKQVMQMKFWQNLTVREISNIIGKPVGTTQRLIYSIYDKLKKEME